MGKEMNRMTGSGDFIVNISSNEDGSSSEIRYTKKTMLDDHINVSLSVVGSQATYEISNDKACFLIAFEDGKEVTCECLSHGLSSDEVDQVLELRKENLVDFQNTMTVVGVKENMFKQIETHTPGWLKKKSKKLKSLAS